MRDRVVARAGALVEQLLVRSGATPVEAGLLRAELRDWAVARIGSVRDRRPIHGGKRVVVTAPGRVELRPFEHVDAGPGEITVITDRSAISPGTERAQWLRLPGARPALPHVPGYSGTGRVVGDGRRVAVLRLPHTSCATVPTAWTVPVPEGVDDGSAALVYLAVIAGYGVDRAGALDGRRVTVTGAGTIGALAHRLATQRGPATTTVVGRTARGERAARAHGADDFVLAGEGPPATADVVIEASGAPEAVEEAGRIVADGGTIVLVGSPRAPVPRFPLDAVVGRGVRVVGAHISALAEQSRRIDPGDVDAPLTRLATEYLDAVDAGLDVSDLVGPLVDPRELGVAYRDLASGALRAAQLDWTRLPDRDRWSRRARWQPQTRPSRDGRPAEVQVATHGPRPQPEPSVEPMRFAAIGCGDIGLANARAVAAAPSAHLVLVQDVSEASARAVGDLLGCAWTTDVDEALDPARVDAVIVSVPHHLHEPLIRRAAAAGLHVIMEKPLAHTAAAAADAVRAACDAGVALATLFPFRLEPPMAQAKELLAAGAIGPVRGWSVQFHADKPASYWHGGFSGRTSSDWRSRRDLAGGGVLIMNLTHYLDLVLHLTGLRLTSVTAVRHPEAHDAVEDVFGAVLLAEGGAVGTITASARTPGDLPNRLEIWGDDGTVRLEPDPAVYSLRAVSGVQPGRWHTLAPEGAPIRTAFVDEFVRDVRAGRHPAVDGTAGLAVQAVVEASYRSCDTGQAVEIELPT